nr:hypothetical protein [Dinophyceae sp. MRD-151]
MIFGRQFRTQGPQYSQTLESYYRMISIFLMEQKICSLVLKFFFNQTTILNSLRIEIGLGEFIILFLGFILLGPD